MDILKEVEVSVRYLKMYKELIHIDCNITAINLLRDVIQPHISHYEAFYVMYLNNSGRLVCIEQHSKGSINSTIIDIRLIFQKAFAVNASSIICAHNHPGGNIEPSREDIKVSSKLKKACKLMDINLLDNIIITNEDSRSIL
jgi:DNA repair protein RadC